MKKKKLTTVLWAFIILVVLLDIVLTVTGVIPVLGDTTAMVGNLITELFQLALVFGLVAAVRRKKK